MERKIPLTFESVILSPPEEAVLDRTLPNVRRAKVRAFSKYANRNQSYITDQVAEQLIDSAITQPVVGWYDPQTGTWAGHVGPELAKAYGYVEDFLGWEPFTDTDNVTRDYAVFSVVLFSEYFDAANKIIGSNQSMELNPDTIKGDWIEIEGTEYFTFTQAQIYSFCVIGTKEPCFSVSAFFTKNTSQYEKLKNLVFEMRKIVEGGDIQMENENLVQEPIVEDTPTAMPEEENPIIEENPQPAQEEGTFEIAPAAEEPAEPEVEPAQEPAPAPAVDFENLYLDLHTRYEEAQNSLTSFQSLLDAANARIEELEAANAEYEANIASLNERIEEASQKLAGFELQARELENNKKAELINSYAKRLSEDEIEAVRDDFEALSYEDLETKLALTFSRKQLNSEPVRVPLVEPQESEFATFMKKYKR